MLRFLVICTLLLFVVPLHAQDEKRAEFRAAFGLHMDKMTDLYAFRGIPENFNCYEGVKAEQVLLNFLHHWDSVSRPPAIVFYHVNTDTLSVWLFKAGKIIYTATPIPRDSLLVLENELRSSLSVRPSAGQPVKPQQPEQDRGENVQLGNSKPADWELIAQKWTDVLLPEVLRPHLAGIGHLFVIPEMNIGQIPFWILRPFGNNSILADSLSYSIIPNVCGFNAWIMEQQPGYKRKMEFKSPLIIGNPAYAPGTGLATLPGAEAEAAAVAKLLGTGYLSGKEAAYSVVRQKMRSSDLIYLATHASSSPDHILDSSWIALAADEYSENGKLYLRKIQHDHIPARMAVLSACQTGYGKVLEGGVVGLGRAFMKAGTSFTTMSLWPVDDRATAELMTAFIGGTQTDQWYQPAGPLRQSILSLRKKYAHPAYWAPFVLFGFTW